MNKKIYVCTTFREFCGDTNSIIQDKFLNTIKNQTYKNYKLIITTFGEKTVKSHLNKIIPEEKFLITESKKGNYKYSLTDVVINAINQIKEPGILIWCTCDIELQPNYFQTLIEKYESGIAGITHPNYFLSHDSKKVLFGPLTAGIDIVFFDTEILKQKNVIDDIRNYRFIEWGIFEQFLCALAVKYAKKKINTINIANVTKHINDRISSNEDNLFFIKCLNQNRPIFEKFLNDNSLSIKFSELLYCHIQFRVLNKTITYRIQNYFDFKNYKSILKIIMPEKLYKQLQNTRRQ